MIKIKQLLFALAIIPTLSYSHNININIKNPIKHDINAKELADTFNHGLSVLVNEYTSQVNTNLDAMLLNIADPQIHRFLQNSSNTNMDFRKYFLAITYFPDYNVNGKDTSFCFVLYNHHKKDIVSNYYTQFPSKDFALNYIMVHEFGHCIYRHNLSINNLPDNLSSNEHELFADIFSYIYFDKKGYPDLTKSTEKFILLDKDSEVHNNNHEFNQFLKFYKDNSNLIEGSDMMSIFKFSYDYINNHKYLPSNLSITKNNYSENGLIRNN